VRCLLTIEVVLARRERSDEGWYVAELLRVKGELLLQDSGDPSTVTADQYFRSGVTDYHVSVSGCLRGEGKVTSFAAQHCFVHGRE